MSLKLTAFRLLSPTIGGFSQRTFFAFRMNQFVNLQINNTQQTDPFVLQPESNTQYNFNTYKVVKDLEGQGLTRGQANSIMRCMEAYTICTAQLLYHRYYTENSIEKATSSNNITADVSITCLFVATKIEETYKKLKDILIVAYYVLCPEGPEINTEKQKRRVLTLEQTILEITCYEFKFLHPHKFLMKFVKKLGGDKSLAFKSYQIVNECYKTTVCLRFPPHTLAVASIYLAIKLLQLNDFPPTPSSINSNDTTCEYEWYELFLCRIEDIEAINRKNRNEDDKNDHSLVIIDKEDVQMTSTSSIPTTNGTDKNNATTRYLFTPTYAIKPIIHY
ncbi:2043_t:CDS:2 [Entrophospora sp. SA101]|nr:2043_t:CDS:2 [Entrophospora sp. SA101]